MQLSCHCGLNNSDWTDTAGSPPHHGLGDMATHPPRTTTTGQRRMDRHHRAARHPSIDVPWLRSPHDGIGRSGGDVTPDGRRSGGFPHPQWCSHAPQGTFLPGPLAVPARWCRAHCCNGCLCRRASYRGKTGLSRPGVRHAHHRLGGVDVLLLRRVLLALPTYRPQSSPGFHHGAGCRGSFRKGHPAACRTHRPGPRGVAK